MFPDLEFVKTCLNAITAKFRRVKSDVDAVKSDVDAVNRSAPDWNESDTASHSYVKNKPCYDYIEPSVVIWASDSAGTSDRSPLVLVDLVDGRLIEGETYRLTVDGVETTYICTAASNGLGLYIGAGFASFDGGIYQSHTDTILRAYTSNLWGEGQKVRLEGPLRRYKKLDISLYDAVTSVNGETGEVEITPESIGAAKVKSMYSDGHHYDAIYGTISGNTCDSLYLGVKTFIQRRIFAGTNEACFRFGYGESPIILAGIKTPTSNDHAANKGYVDKTVAPTPDTTLSIAGKSADAKATGDALRSLSDEISGIPQPDWNQNDSTAADYVKNRTHYEEYGYSDFICSMGTPIEGFSMPNVGESVTVKVDGVEMDYPVISGDGFTYFGTGDLDTVLDSGGWLVLSNPIETVVFANPDTTISIKVNKIHKLDDKFINIDPFVRRYDYLFEGESLIGSRFNAKGYSIDLYKCEKFIRPKSNEMLFGYMSELGFSQILSITDHACFVAAYVYQSVEDNNGNIVSRLGDRNAVLGTDETEMIDIANRYGYKFTERPAT